MKNYKIIKKNFGITLIEFLIIIIIIAILTNIGISAWERFYEINEYNNNIMAVEYTINKSKIIAMEKTINIGICIDSENNQIIVYEIGYERNDNPCSGTRLFTVKPKGEGTQISSSGIIIFDPRGLNIIDEGDICIQNTKLNTYYKIVIGKGYQKIEKGKGLCPY